jgi:hypothetical protein
VAADVGVDVAPRIRAPCGLAVSSIGRAVGRRDATVEGLTGTRAIRPRVAQRGARNEKLRTMSQAAVGGAWPNKLKLRVHGSMHGQLAAPVGRSSSICPMHVRMVVASSSITIPRPCRLSPSSAPLDLIVTRRDCICINKFSSQDGNCSSFALKESHCGARGC